MHFHYVAITLTKDIKAWKTFKMVGPGGLEPPTNGL